MNDELTRLRGERAVLVDLLREAHAVIGVIEADSIDEGDSFQDLLTRMQKAIEAT